MVGRPLLRLNAKQIEMFHNHFKLVDTDSDGRISKTEFQVLFRSLGQTVSNKRLETITGELFKEDGGNDSGMTFEDFMEAFMSHFTPPPSEKAVREAMMLFDQGNTGYISTEELRQILTSRGEKLAQAEIDYLFELIGVDKNTATVDYVSFVENIYRMLPILSPQSSSDSN